MGLTTWQSPIGFRTLCYPHWLRETLMQRSRLLESTDWVYVPWRNSFGVTEKVSRKPPKTKKDLINNSLSQNEIRKNLFVLQNSENKFGVHVKLYLYTGGFFRNTSVGIGKAPVSQNSQMEFYKEKWFCLLLVTATHLVCHFNALFFCLVIQHGTEWVSCG